MHKPLLKHYPLSTKASLSTSATSKSSNQSQPTLSINTKSQSLNRECILFPTYAFRDPSNMDNWIVHTKGWALSLNKPGPKQKVLKGITKSVAGKGSDTHANANKMFEDRFKYFLARGKRNKKIEIEAIGPASNAEWAQPSNNTSSTKRSMISPSSLPYNDSLQESQLKSSPQWQKMLDATKQELNSPFITIHDDDNDGVNPLPIILDTSYTPTSLGSSANHHNASSDEDDDEEGDSNSSSSNNSCDDGISYLHENSITLESESTGVFEGDFRISDQQVYEWTQNNSKKQKRMIKLKSQCKRDFETKQGLYFSPSYGVVQLIEPCGVSIISDIDDTIKDTRVLLGARTVLSNTFFNPTRAIPGMAEVYLQWYNQGASYHYVSNSPFQLVHMLQQFISNHHFPPGSFHLRPNTGIISKLVQESGRSKRDSICKILRDFPRRKFVLVGDSGEIDLEIYTQIAIDFPGQIIKIFIRDITTNHSHHRPSKDKKRRRVTNKRSLTFPAFFTSNLTTTFGIHSNAQRTESVPNLSSTGIQHDSHVATASADDSYEDEDEDDSQEGLHDTATKLAELVLEPSLTGHQPWNIVSPYSQATVEAEKTTITTAAAADHQPSSQSLMQLFSRLAAARKSVKDVDIVLFKEPKELFQDEQVMLALSEYKNDKQ